MGIGGFLRRLRGDQRAMPDPDSPEFQRMVEGSALPGSTEMSQEGWTSTTPTTIGEGQASTMPGEAEVRAQSGAVSQQDAMNSLLAAGVPEESAQAAAAALAQLQQAFGGGAVESGGTHTIDMQGVQGLRDQMHATLREHGVDPDSGVAMDASSVPGLQEALLRVLAENGVDVSQYGA
jgi:hypothetical protein